MLVLTRKVKEVIRIGEDIKVTVTAIRDGKAVLGIDAPRRVAVHRQEVYDAIQQEKGSRSA